MYIVVFILVGMALGVLLQYEFEDVHFVKIEDKTNSIYYYIDVDTKQKYERINGIFYEKGRY
jgi:hypothetical protein